MSTYAVFDKQPNVRNITRASQLRSALWTDHHLVEQPQERPSGMPGTSVVLDPSSHPAEPKSSCLYMSLINKVRNVYVKQSEGLNHFGVADMRKLTSLTLRNY